MARVRITKEDFSIDEVCREVRNSRTGGTVAFIGVVREEDESGRIDKIEIEVYEEMAISELERLREKAIAEFGLEDMSIIHRVGCLAVGENIVLIVAAGAHRAECFAAARFVIDEMKKLVPIWKREFSASGERWVEGDH